MKKYNTERAFAFKFIAVVVVSVGLIVCFANWSGAPADFATLSTLGTVRCEWTDGKTAVMINEKGHQKLIRLSDQHIKQGKSYEVRIAAPRWRCGSTRHYLKQI